MDDVAAALEGAIGELLARRRPDASMCPSEAARAVDVRTARGPVRIRRRR
ncbi:DUF3253 domain-containing protein [Blastococcus sp. SYSU DS0533]